MRLVIGGPTLATVPASFVVSLVELYGFTTAHGPWESVTVGLIASTYVHVGREAFLEAAIQQCQATHVLWLDTDMTVPPDTALRLARHNQPIVAANCVLKDPRLMFTARRAAVPVPTLPDSTGLEAVEIVGLAVMLMRTDVVRDWPRPWFEHGWNEAAQRDIGEDVLFCRRLREAGHTIYIDHDVSKEIGHVGLTTYRIPARAAVTV